MNIVRGRHPVVSKWAPVEYAQHFARYASEIPDLAAKILLSATYEQLAALTQDDLLPLLQSDDSMTRMAAIRALPKIGGGR